MNAEQYPDEPRPEPTPTPDDAARRHVYEPAAKPRRRRVRMVATVTAAAVLGFGLGAGLGVGVRTSDATTSAGESTDSTTGSSSDSTGGSPDSWTVPDQSGTPDYGSGPGGGSFGPGTSQGDDTDGTDGTGGTDTTEATDSQETGMVLVDSTLQFGAGESAGTGMVLTSDGLVVTNHHVVEGATSVTVTVVTTGATYDAEVVGTDATHDVAVLRLEDASGLETVEVDTSAPATGDEVTAVGDAGGDGGSLTAAAGTVTALRQSITVDDGDGSGSRLTGLIQIDADVVSGDSGGAVLDEDGEVVGMTTAASSGDVDITGYAVPMARVLRIAEAIEAGEESGSIEIGYAGFLGVTLDRWATEPTIAGIVEDSAAAELGLESGDTITAVDGTAVTTADQLSEAVGTHAAGDRVEVTWTDAAGESHTGTVTLGAAPVQ